MGAQMVSPEQVNQLNELMAQATGGLINAQPAQQLFETPAPQAAVRQQQQVPVMQQVVPPQQQPQQQISMMPQPQQYVPPVQQAQPLNQVPASQVAQVGPPGSERQMAYENMTHDTNEFLKGLIDCSLPYIAKEAVRIMSDKEKQQVAEAAGSSECGFFDRWYGKAAIGGAGVIAGAGTVKLVDHFFGGNSRVSGEDVAAFGKAFKTLFG